ncbi:MAG: M20 family metallo-hydrolase [Chitinophagaceae bacterium]|nr:M20 family metallo-hydrolase [Chitinophagaceae bacterium]
MDRKENHTDAFSLLKKLIATSSYSGQEEGTASLIADHFASHDIPTIRNGNNIIARNKYFSDTKPTLLLNSHHDTVKPAAGYVLDPFNPVEKDGKLYGLGSNDAGGALVALIAAFLHFYEREDLAYNIILVASAEEEISGPNGIESVLPELGPVAFAIVGEPTQMQMAVAERGLMVLDCVSKGRAGHAARGEGVNAIYAAMEDIARIMNLSFEKVSPLLGPTTMQVTVMDTPNRQHNVVPGECHFVIDVRANELTSFEEILDKLRKELNCEIKPRSTRLRSTSISLDHPLVQAGIQLGKTVYGSPTLSDKALMPFPALKMGPGDSARSHMADEYIEVEEISKGIYDYIELLRLVAVSS